MNTKACLRWANRLCMRQIYHGVFSYADLLGMQKLRILKKGSADVPRGGADLDWTLDRFAEPRKPSVIGLRGALEASPDTNGEDERLSHEKCRGSLKGLSTFVMPRVIRYIARMGCDLKQVDCSNSHLAHLAMVITDEQKPLYGELMDVVLRRSEVFQMLQKSLQVKGEGPSRDAVKKLILSICYGGGLEKHLGKLGFYGSPPDWLQRFHGCVHRLAKQFADQQPVNIEKLIAMGKVDTPQVSLMSYVAGSLQRDTFDKLVAAGKPLPLCSCERDGAVFWLGGGRTPAGWEAGLRGSSDVAITFEDYPSEDEILKLLKEKHPFCDFRLPSKIKYEELLEARRCCEAIVNGIPGKGDKLSFPTPDNVTDFGKLIAARLEPFVMCGKKSTMEYFDPSAGRAGYGMWRVLEDREKVLQLTVRDSLMNEFRQVGYKYIEGKQVFEHYGQPPPAVKRPPFYRNVAADVGLTLMVKNPMAFLDNGDTRRFLQDVDGLVYDFVTDRIYVNEPGIRVGRHLSWSFFQNTIEGNMDWDSEKFWTDPASLKRKLRDLLEKIFSFWLSGEGPKGKSLLQEPVFGVPLAAALKSLVEGSEHCRVWKLYLPMFTGDLDEVLWKLAHQSADICAWRRRCEFEYAYGPGSAGKDTGHLLAIQFFGDRSVGGMSFCIPKDYFIGRNKKADADTVLDSCKHMRYLGNNEVPDHLFFDADSVKPMTENRGTGIVSRTIYEKPERWLPMGGLHLSGNHPLHLSESQCKDSGIARRLNYYKLQHRFPEESMRDIKDEIESGVYNGEMLWLAKLFYGYLIRCPEAYTRIYPRPPRFVKETDDVLNPDLLEPLRTWIEHRTKPVPRFDDGTTRGLMFSTMHDDLKVEKKVLVEMMEAVGMHHKDGNVRVYTFRYPGKPRAQAMKLKDAAELEQAWVFQFFGCQIL